jgi:hypothetical protein
VQSTFLDDFFLKQKSDSEKLESELVMIIFDAKAEIQLESHLPDCFHLHNWIFSTQSILNYPLLIEIYVLRQFQLL